LIDLFSSLTVAPARLQKQNKVLAARTPIAARARVLRASVETLS
jgi:hypothetical protein